MVSKSDGTEQAAQKIAAVLSIPETDVSVYEALYHRRMSWQFKDKPVARESAVSVGFLVS